MIPLDRSYLVVMIEAGYIYLGMQRFEEAKKVFDGLCTLAPESEVPVIALGGVSFCQGDFKRAIALYRQAIQLDPKSFFAKVYLGEALFFSGDKDAAMELLVDVRDADRHGAAGGFASALIDAIHHGFTPKMIMGLEVKHDAKKKSDVH